MRRIHLMFGALVAVVVVTLAACGSSGGNSASGNFCNLVKKDKTDKTLNATPRSFADEKKQLQVTNSAIEDLAAAAPSEIKSDMQTVKKLSNDVAAVGKKAKSDQELATKAQAFTSESKAATSAETKINAYAKKHCGTTLGSGG